MLLLLHQWHLNGTVKGVDEVRQICPDCPVLLQHYCYVLRIWGLHIPYLIFQDKDTRIQLISHGKRSDNALQIKNLIFLAQSDPVVIISPHKLDQQPMLLNCLNGTVDLATGCFRSHDRSDLMTQMIPVNYDITARCPKFIEFINQIMGNDTDLIDYLQKIFGYTLTGDTSEQCYFIFYGGGSNGKSTLINIFSSLMDQYSKAITFNTLTTENNRARNDLARLAGSRMVSSVEVDLQQCFNESVVNRITGGDKIVASFKYNRPRNSKS